MYDLEEHNVIPLSGGYMFKVKGSQIVLCFLLAISSIIAAPNESKVCIAVKNHDINYASFLNYQVKCKNREFETEAIMTTLYLPLPYNWGARARRILDTKMLEFKMQRVAQIDSGLEDDILIYDSALTNESSSNLCTILKFNVKKAGINESRTIFDAMVTCRDESIVKEVWPGITQVELEEYMNNSGLSLYIDTQLSQLMELQGNMFYEAKGISIFRK